METILGLGELERIEKLIARKREIFAWYQEALSGVDGLMLNYEAPGTRNTYWMVTVILDPSFGIDKERLIKLLNEHQIDSRPFFYPLSSLPAYEHLEQARQRNRVSYQISPYGINLPCALCLTERHVGHVCATLKRILV